MKARIKITGSRGYPPPFDGHAPAAHVFADVRGREWSPEALVAELRAIADDIERRGRR